MHQYIFFILIRNIYIYNTCICIYFIQLQMISTRPALYLQVNHDV